MPTNQTVDFTLDDLYNTQTDEALIREANQFRALPSGSYMLTADKVDLQQNPENFNNPGRKGVRVQASAVNDTHRGKVFFNVSWEPIRRDTGKLDKESQLWGQIVKALDMVDKSVGEVVDALSKYPLKAFLTLAFKKPEGGYVYPRSQAEETEALKAQFTPTNFVQSISKAV